MGKMKGQARIYYVPIGTETYVPMTTDNIEVHHVRFIELDVASREYRNLTSLIDVAGDGSFEEQRVRVKILLPDASAVYIDNNGGMRLGSSRQATLSHSSLRGVRKLLEEITKPRQKNP